MQADSILSWNLGLWWQTLLSLIFTINETHFLKLKKDDWAYAPIFENQIIFEYSLCWREKTQHLCKLKIAVSGSFWLAFGKF